MTFTIDVDTTGPRILTGLAARLSNLSGVASSGITEFVRSRMRRQFETEGAAGGTPWAPLAPNYARWKARKYPGRKILVRTGKMKRAFTDGLRAVIFGGGREVTLQFESGESVPYWTVHHRGGRFTPARRIIPDLNGRFFISGVRDLVLEYLRGGR